MQCISRTTWHAISYANKRRVHAVRMLCEMIYVRDVHTVHDLSVITWDVSSYENGI